MTVNPEQREIFEKLLVELSQKGLGLDIEKTDFEGVGLSRGTVAQFERWGKKKNTLYSDENGLLWAVGYGPLYSSDSGDDVPPLEDEHVRQTNQFPIKQFPNPAQDEPVVVKSPSKDVFAEELASALDLLGLPVCLNRVPDVELAPKYMGTLRDFALHFGEARVSKATGFYSRNENGPWEPMGEIRGTGIWFGEKAPNVPAVPYRANYLRIVIVTDPDSPKHLCYQGQIPSGVIWVAPS